MATAALETMAENFMISNVATMTYLLCAKSQKCLLITYDLKFKYLPATRCDSDSADGRLDRHRRHRIPIDARNLENLMLPICWQIEWIRDAVRSVFTEDLRTWRAAGEAEVNQGKNQNCRSH